MHSCPLNNVLQCSLFLIEWVLSSKYWIQNFLKTILNIYKKVSTIQIPKKNKHFEHIYGKCPLNWFLYLNRILHTKLKSENYWMNHIIYILLHKPCWMFFIEIEAHPLWDAQRHWSSSFWLKTNNQNYYLYFQKETGR